MGPPGTGKTDVAVQIISNLYHNFPEQRTLIVTHSNQVNEQLLCDPFLYCSILCGFNSTVISIDVDLNKFVWSLKLDLEVKMKSKFKTF